MKTSLFFVKGIKWVKWYQWPTSKSWGDTSWDSIWTGMRIFVFFNKLTLNLLSCILFVVVLSCSFIAWKNQSARHTEKFAMRVLAALAVKIQTSLVFARLHNTSQAPFARAAWASIRSGTGAKAHSFGELKFPSSQTLLARNGATHGFRLFCRVLRN